MLIVSKFRDYYDSIAGQKGIDKKIVFNRDQNSLFLPEFHSKWSDRTQHYFPNYDSRIVRNDYKGLVQYETYILGICGKLYPLLVNTIRKKTGVYSHETYSEFIYDINIIEEYYNQYNKSHYSWRKSNWSIYKDYLTSTKVQDLFFKHNTPIFILGAKTLKEINFNINPILKDIEFFKVMDPFTIFQEIEMFISQQLCTEITSSNISDKDKIVGHGFDPKWSFRKEPNKNK